MVRICSVRSCSIVSKKLSKEKVSFHLFPVSRPEILLKWVEFLGYGPDWKPSKSSVICSRHFEKKDFKPNTSLCVLISEAVPSIHLQERISMDTYFPMEVVGQPPLEINDNKSLEGGTCRLCSLEYKSGMKSIFQPGSKYALQIFRYLKLTISPSDILPLQLCFVCEEKLYNLEEFINIVTDAQEKLTAKFFPSNTLDYCSTDNDKVISDDFQYDEKNIDLSVTEMSTMTVGKFDSSNFNTVPLHEPCINTDKLNVCTGMVNSISCICIKSSDNKIKQPSSSFPNFKNTSIFPDGVSYNIANGKLDGTKNFIDESCSLKIPIKLEVMTPNVDLFKNPSVKPTSDKMNKKIEILEDIQINPTLNQLAFKSFKSIYDESLSNMNISVNQRIIPCDEQANKINPKATTKSTVETQNSKMLLKSKLKCRYCKKRFIGKYPLNHHLKYICQMKQNGLPDTKHTKLPDSNVSDFVCNNFNPNSGYGQKIKQRRKHPIIVKCEYY